MESTRECIIEPPGSLSHGLVSLLVGSLAGGSGGPEYIIPVHVRIILLKFKILNSQGTNYKFVPTYQCEFLFPSLFRNGWIKLSGLLSNVSRVRELWRHSFDVTIYADGCVKNL